MTMRYRLFGRSGLRVSELALGTMTFGTDWGWGADQQECRWMFDAYGEAGGNFIDTACNYTDGASERIVGELVAADRDHWVLATKYGLTGRPDDPNAGGNHRKNLQRTLEASLGRLGTDHLDLLWLHMWDGMTPVEEVVRTLDDAVSAGKVLYVGVSDTPAWVVARAVTMAELRGWAPFTGLQVPWSLADRAVEREHLPLAAALDLAVTPWGLLEGGELTGKYLTTAQPAGGAVLDPGDRASEPTTTAQPAGGAVLDPGDRASEPTTTAQPAGGAVLDPGDRASEPTRSRPDDVSPRVNDLAREVLAVAEGLGRPPAQVAINWVRQQEFGCPIVPIVGARSAEQLRANLGCLDFELEPELLARLSAASGFQLGFPRSFLESDHVRGLIFGETFALTDDHRRGRGHPSRAAASRSPAGSSAR
jgi:aryl-alcohol dehydrogenase-like predicted oxidoreductase